jgi:WXG100 family type VII secretion target
MALLKVTSEQLQSLSAQVATGSSEIESQLNGLRSQLLPLATDWEGAASGRFQELWDEWQKSAAGIKDSLDGISQLLAAAATTYRDAEDQVVSRMK